MAGIYDVDAAVISTSGYLTNAGVIGFLLGERDALVCDALDHASIVSGGQWSGARQLTFRHNDPDALRNLLRMSRSRFERVLVVIEGHYSMDGDIGLLPEIAAVAREFDCGVMVDEAHSLGVIGDRGHGVREHFGLAGDAVDIWMGTLSKALGSCGGFIAGDGELIDAIRTIAPGVEQFTGGPAPAAAAAALAALDVLDEEPDRLARLRSNAAFFSSVLRERHLDLGFHRAHRSFRYWSPANFRSDTARRCCCSGASTLARWCLRVSRPVRSGCGSLSPASTRKRSWQALPIWWPR